MSLSAATLGKIAELTNTSRTDNAAFFTSKTLITEMMKSLPDTDQLTVKILEPSVGVGNFIPLILKKFEGKEIILDVVDIDEHSLEIAKLILKNYCATLSELALQVKEGRESLIKRAAARLNMFYDYVLIDEFQDFREFDYELIIKLAKHLDDILLVGDYYQHSVSARNNTGKPFKTPKGDVSYADFVECVMNAGFEIDTTALSKSRRCSVDVCNYIPLTLSESLSRRFM